MARNRSRPQLVARTSPPTDRVRARVTSDVHPLGDPAGALVSFAIGAIVIDGSVTSYGHATAFAIGFALYLMTRAPAVRARARGPIVLPD